MSVEWTTSADQEQAEWFISSTKQPGMTPSDALRRMISTFNLYGGFPDPGYVFQEGLVLPFETE